MTQPTTTHWTAPWRMLAALAVVPLIANWPVVSGWLVVDPVYTLSRLGTDFVAGPLPGTTSLDPNNGLMSEALGRLAATDWLAGRIPWWNPFDGIGLPLAAEGQNQALFLPFVLLFALRNGPLLVVLALQEVAAFSTYALLRQLALTRVAAWIGAALFAVNGTFAWLGHGPMMPVAFAPMLLLGIEMEWNATGQRPRVGISRGWVVVAIAIAFSLYAGGPETAYLDGLLGAAWTLLRIVQSAGSDRLRLALRIGAGAVTGLLLAAPYVVPFLQMLTEGEVSPPRMSDYTTAAIPSPALPTLLMPYVLGPQSLVTDWTRVESWLWAFLGGYLTPAVALLAVIAVAAPRSQGRALRWLLAAWCVAMISASFGVPGIARAVYSVPALAQTLVFRYAPPSWELAAIVLAAMAIDDWQRAGFPRKRLGLAVAVVLVAIAVALAVASHSIAYLRANVPHYDPWLALSVGGAVATTLLVAGLLAGRPAAWRTTLLAVLLVGEAISLFSVPRLAGLRRAALDTTAVTYVKQHLGLARVYAFGTLLPNYPAYFQVASINSAYVPAPRLWSEYIRTALDPGSLTEFFDGISVFGQAPRVDMKQFRTFLPAYRELAVRYVLVPPHATLALTLRTQTSAQGAEAAELAPGASLQVTFPGSSVTAVSVAVVAVLIGASPGAANGALSLTACAGEVCQSGARDLASAAGNAPFELRLNEPLPIAAGQDLRLRFTHEGGTAKVAISQFPQSSGTTLPGLAIGYAIPGLSLLPVYVSRVLTVYELTDPAPYFETIGGPCRVSPVTREEVTTDCASPARLIRRELFFDGWKATINGLRAPILEAAPIMQAVDIPSGNARIEFHYAPPYAAASAVAFIVGILLVAFGTMQRMFPTPAQRPGWSMLRLGRACLGQRPRR